MIDVNKVSEGVDYNFMPIAETDGRWAVEVLTGDFAKVGFLFADVQFNKEHRNVSFKLTAVDLYDGSPVDTSNTKIQQYAGEILEDIIKNGISRGTVELDGEDSDQ
jgi:hypothetical protein